MPGALGTAVFNVSVPTPGLMWDATAQALVRCGNVSVYCPGTFQPFDRLSVSDAHYTGPPSAPPDMRWRQSLCEMDAFCIGGERYNAPDVAAATALAAPEKGAFAKDNGLGPSAGDVLRIEFSSPPDTTYDVSSPSRVRELLEASFWDNVSLTGASWAQEPCASLTQQSPGSCHESLMLRFDAVAKPGLAWGLDVSAMADEVLEDPWAITQMLSASPFAGWVSLRAGQLRAADRASPARSTSGSR
ncbi:hypothetical protein FNF31_00308 [Cafeteria roenbergensis]|uniref:Uncharacterized protein n=1 Tax=Cafeteria roenbergensis TaxID=33653 RepID=A0A5A8DSL2_CAFRO|nr:hypothetical protein FNF31_00308 [Cafeteria roenbergensis]